jgi:alanine-glyoxylate transaminase / serine-glyoxylate transaminase / serine-pyruvate transaminase
MSLARGRALRAIPGPSVVPDAVLNAMHRAAPNIYEGELIELTASLWPDLRRVARTSGEVAAYIGNGHAAWEAALANILNPGDRALVVATGRFGHGWAEMARAMGIVPEVMDFGFRAPLDPGRIAERLAADKAHAIRAVLTVQADTASSALNDIAGLRAAMDASGHPALLAVDCIASLACDRFEMDEWGVDVMVAACQKGLMTPPGLGFVFAGPKALAAEVPRRSLYWDWRPRIRPQGYYQHFCGTAPTHHLYGLRAALDMIHAEGIEAVWARHATLAAAVWAAVGAWGARGALSLNMADADARSRAVTTIRTAPGAAVALRRWCEDHAGLTLGLGLTGPEEDGEALFRIGHMGHFDPPMLLGVLGTVEAGLKALGIAHGPGALDAAASVIAGHATVASTGAESLTPRVAMV